MANDIEAAARVEFEAWWDGPLGPYVNDAPKEWSSEKRRSWCAWQASRAVLAAPATVDAKPVAYICVECGALWRKVRIAVPQGTISDSWNMVSAKGCAGCDNGPRPLLDALYREPLPAAPASGAVEEARAAVIEKAKRWERDPYRGLARYLTEAELLNAVNALLAAERAERGGKGA